jgi:hypothetical protein
LNGTVAGRRPGAIGYFYDPDMTLSPHEIVDAWLAAFNRGDADAMVELYADDAVHTSPKLREAEPASEGRVAGKAAMRRWWRESFERTPGLRYEVVATVTNDRVAAIEYDRLAPGMPTMRVAEIFEIEGGKIVRSHVFHG